MISTCWRHLAGHLIPPIIAPAPQYFGRGLTGGVDFVARGVVGVGQYLSERRHGNISGPTQGH